MKYPFNNFRNTMFALFFSLSLHSIYGQSFLEERIAGFWEVLEVRTPEKQYLELDDEEKEEANSVAKAFKGSFFVFHRNGKFEFNTDIEIFENKLFKWIYNQPKNKIIIEEVPEETGDIYLEINFQVTDDEMYFKLLNTPFYLKLRKNWLASDKLE